VSFLGLGCAEVGVFEDISDYQIPMHIFIKNEPLCPLNCGGGEVIQDQGRENQKR
jgi:hypothetical protein